MEGEKTEFRAIKITNPNWLGLLGPQIKILSDKIPCPAITYEALFSYFARNIQLGKDAVEFWAVLKDDEPVAFAHWFICSLPHVGTVSCDYIYSWNRMREPIELLIDNFIKFGKRNRSPFYTGTAISEAVFRVFRKAAYKKGYQLKKTKMTNFIVIENKEK